MQFHPRKRAKSIKPRLRSWGKTQGVKLLAFAGFKAGMTHAFMMDTRNTETKGKEVMTACTVIETPPLFCHAIRAYKNTPYGLKISAQITVEKTDKNISRLLKKQKKTKAPDLDLLKDADEIRLVLHTQPIKVNAIPSKKPRLLEVPISGSIEEQLNYAKEHFGKEINVTDVLSPSQYVDVQAVTKGKGMQGPVKRFGVKIRKRKHRVAKGRHIGTLGDRGTQTPWYTPMAGQMGYHQRCDQNKIILDVSDKPVTSKGGMVNYGEIKNQYVLIKGSIPGPRRRLVSLRAALRKPEAAKPVELTFISIQSKQGR